MISFQVSDMSCDHCVKAITQAVVAADATASVRVDLPSHQVHIEPGHAGAETLRAAIEEAGYTPVAVPA